MFECILALHTRILTEPHIQYMALSGLNSSRSDLKTTILSPPFMVFQTNAFDMMSSESATLLTLRDFSK